MPGYARAEARDWAREKLVGAVNCTIPSFSGDLRTLNEAAIRHDVRLAKQHGFIGTLGVSEVSITVGEYLDFLRIVKDEAGQGFHLVHHASWSNLEQNIEAITGAERARTWRCCPTRRTSTPSQSRTSTTTPRPCATPPASASSCSRCSCGGSPAASTPPTSRRG